MVILDGNAYIRPFGVIALAVYINVRGTFERKRYQHSIDRLEFPISGPLKLVCLSDAVTKLMRTYGTCLMLYSEPYYRKTFGAVRE